MRSKTVCRIICRALLLVLLMSFTGSDTLWAQNYGRVVLRVTDEKGEPVEGAQVTTTCAELPAYHHETKTSKKGRATLAFGDATKTYDVLVVKEGFDPTQTQVKAELRTTTEHEIILRPVGSESTTVDAGRRIFSPSVRVFNEGVELLRAGDLDMAKAKFYEALEKNSDMAAAHSALAAIHLEQGNYQEAITSANRFLELSPGHPTGYRTLYEAHKALGQTDQAENALRALSDLDQGGDSARLLYNEGIEAYKIGDRAMAKKRFAAALEVNPDLGPAIFGLARVHLEEESHHEAVTFAELLLALQPGHTGALRIRYQAYRALEDSEKASEALRDWSAADASVAQEFHRRGIEFFNGSDVSAAIENFALALEANPQLSRAHYYLGLSYVNRGESAEARQHLEKFLDMAPDDPDAGSASEMLKFLGN